MAHTNSLMFVATLALVACSETAATPQPDPRPAPSETAEVTPSSYAPSEDEDSPGPAATLPPAAFRDHPARVYTGPLAKPDVTKAKTYRTRLREAAAAGVQFGGNYAVMLSGCGTHCIFGFVIDETNGRVMPLPIGGEEHPELQLAFRPDSKWMRAIWKASSWGEPGKCALQDFVIEAGRFRSVRKEVLSGACPNLDDGTGESTGEPIP